MPRYLIQRTKSKNGMKGTANPAMQPHQAPPREIAVRGPKKRPAIDEAITETPVVKAEGHLEQGRGEKAARQVNPNRKKIVRGDDGKVDVSGMENSRAVVSDDIVADPLGDDDFLGEDENGEEIVEDLSDDDDRKDEEFGDIEARMLKIKEQNDAEEEQKRLEAATKPGDKPATGEQEKFPCRFAGCNHPTPFGSAKGRNAHEKAKHDGFIPPEQ